MKITFFGTSHGAPELNRKCTSTLIEVGESRYFIDMGSQSIEGLVNRGIDVNTVKAVFITHMHGDHTHGLLSFVDLCGWYFKSSHPKIFVPCEVEKIKSVIDEWFLLNGSVLRDNIEFFKVNEGVIFDDGTVKITAFKTMHCQSSFAYLVECEGRRVLFSGDLNHHPETDFPMSVFERPLDICVCESAHFEFTRLLPIFEGKDVKNIYFNHLYPPRLNSFDEIKTQLPVTIAKDGMQIEL